MLGEGVSGEDRALAQTLAWGGSFEVLMTEALDPFQESTELSPGSPQPWAEA